MPTPEFMRQTAQHYLERVGSQDLEAVLGLFAESISVEDPVGGVLSNCCAHSPLAH